MRKAGIKFIAERVETKAAYIKALKEFKSKGIVAMRADWTNRNPEITRLLTKFGRSGVPLYVVFPAGRPGQPIVLPEIITSGIVLEAIASAVSIQAVAQP